MKLGAGELKRLRLPVAACVVLTIAGAACYFAVNDYLLETKKLAAATSAQRIEAKATFVDFYFETVWGAAGSLEKLITLLAQRANLTAAFYNNAWKLKACR